MDEPATITTSTTPVDDDHIEILAINTSYDVVHRMTVPRSATWYSIKLAVAHTVKLGNTRENRRVIAIYTKFGRRMAMHPTVEETLRHLPGPGWKQGDPLKIRLMVGDEAVAFKRWADKRAAM